MSSASARPNFVKLAAVQHALSLDDHFLHTIVHTGQHYDPLFSDVFFQQLRIPEPTENLGVKGGQREEVISKTEHAMKPVLERLKPNVVLVYGDVSGAVGAARAAKALGIRLGHIEAGLRSFDRTMPEELNRMEIDSIADDLFVTEKSGLEHLTKEKVRGAVHHTGNTMIDTLLRMMPAIQSATIGLDLPPKFGIATIHRPSNVDTKESLSSVLSFLGKVSAHIPILLPVHHRTKSAIESFGLTHSIPATLKLIEPLGYIEFLHLLLHSAFIITDSGGVQEEATLLKKRCFTLRRNTERPSTIESGSNVLIDEHAEKDVATVLAFASHPLDPSVTVPELWDGRAGERILDVYRS